MAVPLRATHSPQLAAQGAGVPFFLHLLQKLCFTQLQSAAGSMEVKDIDKQASTAGIAMQSW